MRESVADKKIPVFLHFLPLGEVGGVADSLTNLPSDVEQVGLPRQAGAFLGVPSEMPFVLRGVIDNIFGKILNIARLVVDPRQGHVLAS